jgi:hypothetical protein
MTNISSPNDLPGGWHEMYLVADEAEAQKISDGRECYLFKSKAIKALYLFVPQIPFTDDALPDVIETGELGWLTR